jgi:hypothetical protein
MTLRGKTKALSNNPAAQVAAITAACDGIVPTKPLSRKYPGAAWQEGSTFFNAKIICGVLTVKTTTEQRQTIRLFSSVSDVSSYLSKIYHRRISTPDLQSAVKGPVSVPTFEESQFAVICWVKGARKLTNTTPPEYQYCEVGSDGIRTGTDLGKPKLKNDSHAPIIEVMNTADCIEYLRNCFKLNVGIHELEEAMGKIVKVPKIEASLKKAATKEANK